MADAKLKRLIQNYLVQHNLSKIACVTNILPQRNDQLIRNQCLNYICFCLQDEFQRAAALFFAYLYGLRSVEYDVIIASPEQCLRRRQFGYLHFQFDEISEVNKLLAFIIENKLKINRGYPIIAHFKCNGVSDLQIPESASVNICLEKTEIVLDIK